MKNSYNWDIEPNTEESMDNDFNDIFNNVV